MLLNEREKLASVLKTSADVLDIPEHVYEDATLKYEDVGDHLSADDSDLKSLNPQIYVQGSFRLGTVIHPHDKDGEYDIDLVCRLEIKKESISQVDLKDRVGSRLKKRADLSKMLSESGRCWVLDYPSESGMPGFHMDVLPSIPNDERLPTGILLTDVDLAHWQKSNPLAYAEWFKSRMEVVFLQKRAALAESMSASIEEIPDWRVKTPLQRCVQILKRHRDIYFEKIKEIRPASITLTTLAAHAYRNEEDIFDALTGIAERMPNYIENRNGRWWVASPVDDGENFADKWNEYPERRLAFLAWLKKVSQDFSDVAKAESIYDGLTMLNESLGSDTMEKVASELGVSRKYLPAAVDAQPLVPPLADGSHAETPVWRIVPQYNVSVSKTIYRKKNGKRLWLVGDASIPRDVWIKFKATTNAPLPHRIEWQIVNTGTEAVVVAKQPRGEFQSSEDSEPNVRWERTAYRGTHWVEAFVINNAGVCIGRSDKILVKIR